MDVALTEDQRFFQETTRKFLEQEAPLTKVRAWADVPDGFDRGWWRQCAELGFTSFLVPESAGGGSLSGNGLLDLMIVAEEMGRLVSPGPLGPVNVVAAAVGAEGTADQRDRLLGGIVSGDTIVAWHPGDGDVTVRRDGEQLVLRGTAPIVEAAGQASEVLITAAGPDGPTQVLVATDAPGVTVTALEAIDLTRRFARVELDDATVDASALVGAFGGAADALARQLRIARILQCGESAGAMDRVLEFTIEYMGDRYSFGRPLSSYQALKHRVADMKMALEASHGVTTMAARKVQEDAADADEFVNAACAYVGQQGTWLVQEAVQLHGGIGVTWEHDLHLYLRRVTSNRMLLGTPSEHLEQLAAESFDALERA